MIIQLSHFTELLIYESAIDKQSTPGSEPNFERFERYQHCLISIKAWLDTFFSTPFVLHTSMPYISYPQLFHVVVCLHRITTIQDPAWDRAAARQIIDLIPTLDKIIDTFEQLKAAAALISPDWLDDDAYSWGVRVYQNLKSAWQAEVLNMDRSFNARQEANVADTGQASLLDMPMIELGDAWISETLDTAFM